VTVKKSFKQSVQDAIKAIDAKLSKQLNAIMHHEKFQKLEGSWRGLAMLVDKTETCRTLKLRVLNVTKQELLDDLTNAIEWDQSEMFKKIYRDEFSTAGGVPYGAMVGDYEFSNHPEDVEVLARMSQVAAAGFCPFLSAASPQMFMMDSFTDLPNPRDLEKIFEQPDWIKWESFRQSPDSRFVVLTLPRVLARLPYGEATKRVKEFNYEECDLNAKDEQLPLDHDEYTWMNAAYALGAKITHAFAKTNWCTAIRGYENGGVVGDLPIHVRTTEDGREVKIPTETLIDDRRDAELSKLGFMGLVYHKNADKAIFLGGQTTQRPKEYLSASATANAAISARLPYMMASGRIAHYLKLLGREKLGSGMTRQMVQDWLNRWLKSFVLKKANPSTDDMAEYPLAEAEAVVTEIEGKPGSYNAQAFLRPWLQLEELNAAVSMVAEIPKFK
jgi:type VI secretion system protein ImpC